MSKRNKIIIVAVVIIGVLLIVLLVLSLGEKAPLVNDTNQPDKPDTTFPTGTLINTNLDLPTTMEESKEQSSLMATAITFAEKYGSYSTQSEFENLKDLKVMMTSKMIAETNSYIEEKSKEPDAGIYVGNTTKAISTKIISLTGNTAEVIVQTQRSESQGTNPQPRVYYQDIQLQFQKIAGAWKVESALWQSR